VDELQLPVSVDLGWEESCEMLTDKQQQPLAHCFVPLLMPEYFEEYIEDTDGDINIFYFRAGLSDLKVLLCFLDNFLVVPLLLLFLELLFLVVLQHIRQNIEG
jgi:hypothetical protein